MARGKKPAVDVASVVQALGDGTDTFKLTLDNSDEKHSKEMLMESGKFKSASGEALVYSKTGINSDRLDVAVRDAIVRAYVNGKIKSELRASLAEQIAGPEKAISKVEDAIAGLAGKIPADVLAALQATLASAKM